jgi:S-adenosylmethionine:tRNA ribosyltransferase-isomerase
MMNPRELFIDDFDYPLPASRIAEFPLENRDSSKLLVYRGDQIREAVFRNIAQYLPEGSTLVTNDSKVVEARLLFRKPTGGSIEVFCLEPDDRYPDITTAFAQTKQVYWKCLVGNASSWTKHLRLEKKLDNNIVLHAEMISRENDHFIIQLSWLPETISFAEILHEAGVMPLPPYIKRGVQVQDAERYQTIYAQYAGSVAAPTAGLHFTEHVLQQLKEKNVAHESVTLHVGAGTFKPVKSDTIADHDMHSEYFEIKKSLIEKLLANTAPVIAVGTTSLRTLESLYWIGVKLHQRKNIAPRELTVTQWEPYEASANISTTAALTAVLAWMNAQRTDTLTAKTGLLIAPGYDFKIVSVLVTNFHQPKSTLLLLIAAFIGEKWKSVYAYALEHDFRFLSYGDSCLFYRH